MQWIFIWQRHLLFCGYPWIFIWQPDLLLCGYPGIRESHHKLTYQTHQLYKGKFLASNNTILIGLSIYGSVYSWVVRGELSPHKISDSSPNVVGDLITATLHQLIFTKNALRFKFRATNMQNFLPQLQVTNSAIIIV